MALSDQIRLFVHEHLTEVPSRSHGDEIAVICIQAGCGDVSGNRSINVRTGKTSCWRCHVGGHVAWWAKSLGLPADFEDMDPGAIAIDEIAGIIDGLDAVGDRPAPSGYIPSVKLPKGFTRLEDEPDSAYGRLIERLARRKNLVYDDFIRAGVGFTRDDYRWEPFAIFPVKEWGRDVYYQGRTYVDSPGKSTKLFPSKTECALGSKYWVYNIDAVETGGVVVLTEAILNVLSLINEFHRRGIGPIVPTGVFKHKLSTPQMEKLVAAARRASQRGTPVTEFCVMYDGRTKEEAFAGKIGHATRTAREDAAALSSSGVPVTIVDLPDDTDPNDDASLAVDCFLRRKTHRLSCLPQLT